MNRRTIALALVSAALALTACDYRGASSLPLPGGVGTDGYPVTIVFDDVTNLVVKETCRAGDVVVGSVEEIDLRDDFTAAVVCRIDPDVQLAGNAVGTLRETSLLGERFVALDPPAGEEPRGVLASGAVLDEADSHVVPDAEVVLGALSQVLNGGGLANIETISRELSTALVGSDLGATTAELGRLVGTLDTHRAEIVAALESVDRLASTVRSQRDVLGSALESVPAGLTVLERQRPRLVRTLTALGDLSDVAVPLIRDTQAATVADLRSLGPILSDLADAKDRLARAMEGIITFPFPSYSKYVTRGDYAGMFATISLDVDSLNKLLASRPELAAPGGPASSPPPVDLPDLPSLPQLPELPVPELLELLPGLELPGLGAGLPRGQQQLQGAVAPQPPGTLAELLTGGAS